MKGRTCARYALSDGTLCSTHNGRFRSPSESRCELSVPVGMTAMTCPCTLHPRKGHTDPCRACNSKHAQASRPSARSPLGRMDQPTPETPDASREDASRMGVSTDRTTRATRGESNGRSLEPHRRKSASGIAPVLRDPGRLAHPPARALASVNRRPGSPSAGRS